MNLIHHILSFVSMKGKVFTNLLHKADSSGRVLILVKCWRPQADAHGVGQDHQHGAGYAGLARDTNLEQ